MPHTDMTSCPSDDALSQYLDGGLSPGTRPDLERHLAVCPACLDILRLLQGDPALARPAAPAPARRPALRIAAAALALGVGAAAWIRSRDATPPPPAANPAVLRVPAWPSGATPLPASAWAAGGVDLVAEAGADARLGRDAKGHPVVDLKRGEIWIAASREISLEAEAGPLVLRDAEVWVSRRTDPAPLATLLFKESQAAEGDTLSVVVLQGLAVWKGRPLLPGQTLEIRHGVETVAEAAPGRLDALRAGRSRRLEALEGWRDLLPPGERLDRTRPEAALAMGALGPPYRILIRLEAREAATEVAVALPTPEGLRQWTTRLPSRTRTPDSLLELAADGEIFTARIDGIPVLSVPQARLASCLETASGHPGIRSWGGGLRVARASLWTEPTP